MCNFSLKNNILPELEEIKCNYCDGECMLKNGCYLPVHFTNEMKKLIEKFAKELNKPQSKVCEMILQIELPKYVQHYEKKKEIEKWES